MTVSAPTTMETGFSEPCCITRLKAKYKKFLPNWIVVLIWTVAFAILIPLTLKDVLPLISDYQYNNVATNAKLVLIDEYFQPPQMVLCVPFYKFLHKDHDVLMQVARLLHAGKHGECDQCKVLARESFDVWNHKNLTAYRHGDLEPFYNALSLALVHKMMTNMESKKYDLDMALSHDVLLSAALNYFLWQATSDGELQAVNLGPKVDEIYMEVAIQDDWKTDKLFIGVLKAFCEKIVYADHSYSNDFSNATLKNGRCRDLFLDPDLPLGIDWNYIWVTLPDVKIPQIKEYRFAFFQNDSWLTANSESELPFLLYPDIGIQYATVIDQFFSTYFHETPIERTHNGHNVTVRYSVQMRAKETRESSKIHTCYNGTSASVCFTKCTKHWIIKKCQCVPFSLMRGLQYEPGLPYCTFPMYTKCNITSLASDRRELCDERCRSSCEYTSYSWQIDRQTIHRPQTNKTTEYMLRMVPQFNAFVEFSWTDKNTLEQFFAQAISIVNFYLGVSGLTIFTFMIYCVELVKHHRKHQADNDGEGGASVGSSRQSSGKAIMDTNLSQQNHTKAGDDWSGRLKDEIRAIVREELKDALRKAEQNRERGYGRRERQCVCS